VKSTFRKTGTACGLQCDEVFFHRENSAADDQSLSHLT